jgi:hypothetical protein
MSDSLDMLLSSRRSSTSTSGFGFGRQSSASTSRSGNEHSRNESRESRYRDINTPSSSSIHEREASQSYNSRPPTTDMGRNI